MIDIEDAKAAIEENNRERLRQIGALLNQLMADYHFELRSMPLQIPRPDGSYEAVALPVQIVLRETPAHANGNGAQVPRTSEPVGAASV